jgi:Phosphotransferase enzyme family
VADSEEPLPGGGMAPVVRSGQTVRRRTGPWTPAVHALLRHLEAVGFDGAPRVLGIDEDGREVLTFVEGVDGHHGKGPHTDEALAAAGRLIRRYHDAVAGFSPPPGAQWRFQAGAPREGIVCHNDLGPVNTIYSEGVPTTLIDWDFAAPAPPAWDLAYAAYRFAPLYDDADCVRLGYPVGPRGPRIRVLCDAYGLEDRHGFLDLIAARVRALYDTVRLGAEAGDPQYTPIWAATRGEQWLRTLEHIAEHHPQWQGCL